MEIEDSEDENGSSFETPNKLSEDVISEFKAWLRSADGGKLDEKTNQQHGKQVSNLLKVVDDKCDLTPLFDDHLINQVPRGLRKERIPPQNNAELFDEFTSLLLLLPH